MSAAICQSSSVGRDEVAHQDREQIIIDHRAVIVAGKTLPPGSSKIGAPEKDGAGKRDQAEERAQEIIPAVNKGVLESDIEDGEVFGEIHDEVGAVKRLIARS